MGDKVRYEVSGSVATVTIARPDVRNAMDMDVFAGLAEAGAREGADPAVRAVVVAGEGPTFGAGLQLAIACDFRVAANDVQLSVMEVRWGILPDLGATQRLPRMIGL